MNAQRHTALHEAIKAVCPIHGVSVTWSDRTKWRIDFKDEATQEQRTAAQAVMDAFDPNGSPSAEDREAECLAALNGGATNIDLQKLIKAKAISDEAYRLGKPPGQLTAQELTALRSRIANIYKAL